MDKKNVSKSGLNFSGIVCLSLLTLPAILSPISKSYNQTYLQNVEKRNPNLLPKAALDNLIDDSFYKELDNFLVDQVAFRGLLIQSYKFAEIKLLKESRIGSVDIGKSDWMYLRESYWNPKTQTEDEAYQAIQLLEDFLARTRQYNADFRLVVAPDKHTIYPEYLSSKGVNDIKKTARAREVFHSWFYQTDDERIINLWQKLSDYKSENEDLVYIPGDTHHTYTGAMIMAREIIDSIQPDLWQENAVQQVGQIPSYDLNSMLGLKDIKLNERFILDVMEVQRPDVKNVSCIVQGRQYQCTNDLFTRSPSIQSISASSSQSLIRGKTLIIHDSFVKGFLRPSLAQFFENVSFVHHNDLTSESFHQALQDYDYVILETVERSAFSAENSSRNLYTFNRLMRPPLSDAWVDPKAKSVWNFYPNRARQRIAADQSAQLTQTSDGLEITTSKAASSIAFKVGKLSASGRYIIRVDMTAPVNTETAMVLAGKRKIFKPILSGRNQVFFEFNGAEVGQWIGLIPGQKAQTYYIRSVEIKDVADVDAGIADDHP